MHNSKHAIILFDGACILCNRSVQLLIKFDKKEIFKFALLQSQLGKQLAHSYNIKTDSVILIYKDISYVQSNAILQIFRILGGIWLLPYYIFKILPISFQNYLYIYVARNRYKWFGRRTSCPIHNKTIEKRLLR